jgi:hypothetical protein
MENSNATLSEIPPTPLSQFANQRIRFGRNRLAAKAINLKTVVATAMALVAGLCLTGWSGHAE